MRRKSLIVVPVMLAALLASAPAALAQSDCSKQASLRIGRGFRPRRSTWRT
jgi:hypothetical protein